MENTGTKRPQVLRIDSSGKLAGSSTRALLDDFVAAIEGRYDDVAIQTRDLANGMPHVDHDWISANFTPAGDRSREQQDKLRLSDTLIEELQMADLIVIGVPVYNFGVPAALKAWVDMIARVQITFRYTEKGPVGLLQGKKVCLVVASGGVAVDSAIDFATPYMRQALGFVGITDIDVIAADQQIKRGDDAMSSARAKIAEVVHTTPSLIARRQVA